MSKGKIENKQTRYEIKESAGNTSNQLHFNNPWVVAWWSLAFPGYGHFLVNSYLWGFVLMSFEYSINSISHINTSIYYSMIGDFDKAKQVVNLHCFFLYISVYIFSVWDAYRRAIDTNRYYQLAYSELRSINPMQFTPLEVNLLEKKIPWVAILWAFFLPSLSYIYLQRIWSFLLGFGWWLAILYFSNLLPGIYYTMIGHFDQAKDLLSPQWVLNLASIYTFHIYNSYVISVENNKLFEQSQSRYLKNEYQPYGLDHLYEGNEQWT